MRDTTLPNIKRVRAKGRTYLYYKTGRTDAHGKQILVRLPSLSDPNFGAAYASLQAGRTRRENAKAELTVLDLIRLYERSPKFEALSRGTRKIYGIALRRFGEALPTAPAGEIERSDVALLVDKLADKPGAANSLLATIGALYKWARGRGHVANDPAKDIELLEVGEHDPWPTELLESALAADDTRVRLATHLLYYTAQRIGDVCRIRWTDISNGVLFVRQQKTGRELHIRIHRLLAAELARHDKSLGTIITGERGQRVGQQTVRACLQDFAAERGFKIVPHGLRKNAVNALLEAGCSAAQTAAISGQTLQMVEHYAKQRAQSALGSAAILQWENRN